MEWTEHLLAWYEANKRDLPWRRTTEAYPVWISEIMLQQTRVEAVRGYWTRFLEALPTVEALATVEEDRLLKLWEGLGYYSRARNLKRAAQQIMERFGGALPKDYAALLSLPGIGEYTAGAIASIAFGIPVPAVDGNVLRVMARLRDDASDILDPAVRRAVRQHLCEELPAERPGAFNQAMMELGATVCLPNGAPLCLVCPLQGLCTAHAALEECAYPVKAAKAQRRIQSMTVFVLRRGDCVVLRKRPQTGLLAGLYEFPHVEGYLSGEEAADALRALTGLTAPLKHLCEAKHIFTHLEWRMTGYGTELPDAPLPDGLLAVPLSRVGEECPIPSAFRAFTRTLGESASGKEP